MISGCIPKGIHDHAKFCLSFPDMKLQQICQQLFIFADSRASDVIGRNLS